MDCEKCEHYRTVNLGDDFGRPIIIEWCALDESENKWLPDICPKPKERQNDTEKH